MAYIGEGGVKQLAVLINNRYITADAVDTKISDAVKDIAGFKTEVVASLPTTGVEGTIYFAPSSNAEDGNSYDEFIWIASQTKFEQVGSTKVDLDDYAKTEDIPTKVSELTNDSGFLTQHQSLEGYAKTDDLYDPDNKDTLAKLSTSDDGTLLFDGSEIKGGGDTVEVTQTLTSGAEIGSIKVGDETTVLYAPEGGSGGSTEVENMYINIDRYTEDEIVVGEYMGKPLYRRVASGTTITTANISGSRYHIPISGYDFIEKLVSGYGVVGNYCIPAAASNNENKVTYSASITSKGGLNLFSDTADRFTNLPYRYYIEYTKTTDAENSFTPSMITDNKTIISAAPYFEDYSTEEKVIGRYVDGRPIYKKTIIDKMPSVTTNGEEEINTISITDIKDCVECAAFIQRSETRQIPMYFYKNDNGKDCYQYIATDSNGVEIHNSRTLYNDIPVILHIKYTKTTDAPNSFKPEMITSGIMADEPASDAEVDEIFN